MKYLLLPLFVLASSTFVNAQFPGGIPSGGGQQRPAVIPGTSSDDAPRGNAKISGVVIDSVTKAPVEFASVALVNPATNRPIDGATADDKGRFTINRVLTGEFTLLVQFIGYRTKTIRGLKINSKNEDLNLGNVVLSSDVRKLSEVTVTGQSNLVEEKVDRLVYNAEKDLTARGGDATDVMRKVPLLTVDLDGNVSLRGSQNVQVLINNKPSTIIASSVADALKQIPADMIKTVEVITSPSARYDAEGSAGIINIITKKNTLQGFTLNVDSGVGNRGANLGLNGNLRTGKMGFSLNGFGRANYNIIGAFENVQTTQNSSGNIITRQSADTRNRGQFGQYQLGWDYDIDKNTSLTASLRFGARNNISNQDLLRTESLLNNVLLPRSNTRNVLTKDLSNTVDFNVAYTKNYKPQQEFSVLALFSRNNRNNDFTADILNNTNLSEVASRQRNDNTSFNQESTLQVDYQTPIKTNQLIEFGGKGIFRQVQSIFSYSIDPNGSGAFIPNPSLPANTLIYDQNVAASYASYTRSTKNKWTFKGGLRYEYTFINARFSDPNSTEGTASTAQVASIPDYGNLIPSVNISKNLKGGKTVKLAYNRRLQRPGIQFLNPNPNLANPLNISRGNPVLNPELTDNFELGTSQYIKSVFVNITGFARFTNNGIQSVRTTAADDPALEGLSISPEAIVTTFQNIGRERAYGVTLFGNATLFSKWQIGGGFETFYAYLTNGGTLVPGALTQNITNSGMVVSGRLFSNLTLKKGWGIQAFGFARGRQVQLQGYQGGFAFYNLGVRKEFNEKRGSVGMAFENFLNHPFRVRSEFNTPGLLAQTSLTSFYNAGVRVNFSYRIGKMSFDQPQRQRRSAENDDLKSEGGDNGGGQQPQGGAPAGGGRRPR